MNKKLIIWAIVIIVLALALFFAFNNSNSEVAQIEDGASSINPASAPTLESDDDVFNEFDNAITGLE